MIAVSCCSNQVINQFHQICCQNTVRERKHGSVYHGKCCGNQTLSNNQTCCDNHVTNVTDTRC
ncbi:unnamed protein product [Anisakis simplex]|uniref:Galaxin-like repeats domain-containing protein n=1 Tax=Anisakis simplex TaxID=6269 RepID=A0A3P6REH6_ANISI|nr:unnamed protein product [Anisakis simplex]